MCSPPRKGGGGEEEEEASIYEHFQFLFCRGSATQDKGSEKN